MKMPKYVTKKEVKKILGMGLDDEGLISVSVEDINEIIDYYIIKMTNR